jgi:hypothetical protein
MSTRTYTVVVTTTDPEADLDLAMREAVGYLSEYLDAEAALKITVTDDEGSFVTEHEYDPDL